MFSWKSGLGKSLRNIIYKRGHISTCEFSKKSYKGVTGKFCDAGPPNILHSDSGSEFKNEILFSTLSEKWPTLKIINGKPRHQESQGALERAN